MAGWCIPLISGLGREIEAKLVYKVSSGIAKAVETLSSWHV